MFRGIILLLVIIFSIRVTAIAGNGSRHGIGIIGGLNFNTFNAQGWSSKYESSPHGGLFAYMNGRKFGVQVEAHYATTTIVTDNTFAGLYQQYLGNLPSAIQNAKFDFTLIQVPLMLNYKYNKNFWIQGGINYTSYSKLVDKNNLLGSTSDIIASGSTSAIGGVWIRAGKRFAVNGRYLLGLGDLNSIPNSPQQWTTNTIQVGLAMRIL